MLKIAIVGTGIIVKQHLNAIEHLDDVELVAVCDVNEEKAGRKMYLDRVHWIDGWPQITLDRHPSVTSPAPYIKKK
jgi:predicted dinucleotide-utilizing enzyme